MGAVVLETAPGGGRGFGLVPLADRGWAVKRPSAISQCQPPDAGQMTLQYVLRLIVTGRLRQEIFTLCPGFYRRPR